MLELASFWAGGDFTELECMCALSFLKQGHSLTVYTFGDIGNIPEGVQIRDSREVFSSDKIIRYKKSKSPSLHSNIFRYALLAQTDNLWVDLDVLALRPFDMTSEYIFAFEDSKTVNTAVLRLPKKSAALTELLRYDQNTVSYPPAISRKRRFEYQVKSLWKGIPIENWPWGSIGPRGLTHYLRQSGEISNALPMNSFYPVPPSKVNLFADPSALSRSEIPRDCYGVHLWGKYLRRYVDHTHGGAFPEKSFIGQEIISHNEWANKRF